MSARHTVGRWLLDSAARDPHAIAIDDRGVRVDYAVLSARATALGERLKASGYGPGHRVACVATSSTDQIVAFFACALAGVTFAPLSWRLTAPEVRALVTRLDPEAVLTDEQHHTLVVEALAGASSRACLRLGSAGIEAHVPPVARPTARRAVRDDDPLLVIFTSGSAAEPKGVVLTHESCFWTNLALHEAMPIAASDVVLAMLPPFHVAAWNVQPLLAWWMGATVVLEPAFEPSRALRLIEDRGVTVMMGVPTQYRMLTDDPDWEHADLASLRLAVAGGAPLPSSVSERWARRSVSLTPGYGLTEAGPNVLVGAPGDAERGSVGRPYPHVEVALVDPDTRLVLEGAATGELIVRGPAVFAGYLGDLAATEAALEEGWLRTGDLARRDADGGFRIVGRLKDIFISGGENVAPAEVEAALESHALVTEAAVVAVDDEVWGERGFAFVVVRAGSILTADELRAHARDRLAGYKVPVRFMIVDALPRVGPHKIARSQLRARATQIIAQEVSHDR